MGSAQSSRPSSPIRTQLLADPIPVNLFSRKHKEGSTPVSDDDSDNNIILYPSVSNSLNTTNKHSKSSQKRQKQTHVPNINKDERYWARRLKNNEGVKQILEKLAKDLKNEVDRMAMDNKKLTLKMDIIMEENNRLKTLLSLFQQQQIFKFTFSLPYSLEYLEDFLENVCKNTMTNCTRNEVRCMELDYYFQCSKTCGCTDYIRFDGIFLVFKERTSKFIM
ncbi:unnamed protein product [Lepeophtheirus salmonis]|uniref:(salmon louse) hypothetical protein n=1 Tax=Lepeophtheirus salmonis TaxID=72036 RepID=A0A7R8D6I0_LEPSM|nr:unnamed protein product [Lepeophtheirus salmonis]CAF3044521.1 unnamed protein product [Lepeophtheirus salmonis]